MLLWFFGIIDVLAAIAFVGIVFDHPFNHLQAGMGLAIIVKGLITMPDILSVVDVIIGLLMFWFFWHTHQTAALCLAIYLAFKGLYSFV
ncbi:MAG: hypothetical protein OXR66_03795 [Candidatus Woesearchaeota archaeon]|nr:hypothetical protein [Candidatus Woesearchaeota archaeon]